MKFLVNAAIAMSVTALIATKSFAFQGGVGDGGGNGLGSSPAEVVESVKEAKLMLGVFIHAAASDPLNPLNPSLVKDRDVRKVIQSWLAVEGDAEALVSDGLKSDYKTQTAECPSQTDNDHDASTQHKRNAVICFSISRLSRFPKWTLPAELVALAAHEHAHHFGFGEVAARAVQRYVFSAYAILQIHELANSFFNNDTANYRARLKLAGGSAAGEVVFVKMICRDFYAIEGQAAAYNLDAFKRDKNLETVCDPDGFDPDAVDQRLRDLLTASIQSNK